MKNSVSKIAKNIISYISIALVSVFIGAILSLGILCLMDIY